MPLNPVIVLCISIKAGLTQKLTIILQVLFFPFNKYRRTKSEVAVGAEIIFFYYYRNELFGGTLFQDLAQLLSHQVIFTMLNSLAAHTCVGSGIKQRELCLRRKMCCVR